jgi:ATP-dependent DNA ligase
LKRRATAFDNDGWLFELKYDGFRALLEIDGAGSRLVSRNRNRFRHLDQLAAALATRLSVKGHPRLRDHLRRRDGTSDLH